MDIDNLLAGLSDDEDEVKETFSDRARQLLETKVTGPSDLPLCVSIDNTISGLYDKIAELYSQTAPELSSLIADKSLYCLVVEQLGADPTKADLEVVGPRLTDLVGKQLLMSLRLSPFQSPSVFVDLEDCRLVVQLTAKRQEVLAQVAPQLGTIAPNLLCIISPDTCAQLLAYTGSLESLASAPSANIPSLGSNTQRAPQRGAARQGILWRDPVFKGVAAQHMRAATRIVAGKLILAARVDLSKRELDNPINGQNWSRYIRERLDKLGAPPPNKLDKALPVPQELKSKVRGGKRARRFKEKYHLSELQKQNNRLSFGVDAQVKSKQRAAPATSQLEVSKKMRERLAKLT